MTSQVPVNFYKTKNQLLGKKKKKLKCHTGEYKYIAKGFVGLR